VDDSTLLSLLPDINQQHAVGLVHIALNINKHYCNGAVLLRWLLRDVEGVLNTTHLEQTWQQHTAAMEQHRQHVNQPDVVCQLLQTAVLRRHYKAIPLLCRTPTAHRLSVEDVSNLMAVVVCIYDSDRCAQSS
jgi:hypothetical protein